MLPTIETARLSLRPVNAALIDVLVLGDRAAFGALLGGKLPPGDRFPPLTQDFFEYMRSWFTDHPGEDAWTWFGVDRARGIAFVNGGFGFGPDADGVVTLGYSTYPSEEGHGYASELASGLVEWALAERGAPAVLATIPPAHHASIRVAERAGLVPVGTAVDAEVGEVLVFRRDR